MKKAIRVERVYKLAEYNTLRLEEQTIEIPDNLALNMNFIGKVYDLAFINLEINYRKYLELMKEIYTYTDETLMKKLEEIKENTIQDLITIIEGVK